MTRICVLLALWAAAGGADERPAPPPARQTIDLAGVWRFQLDPDDAGQNERWFDRSLSDTIRLPGSLQEQGFGEPVSVDTQWIGGIVDRSWFTQPEYAPYRRPGHVKIPFWLQPDRHYVGAAWYERAAAIPPEWEGRRVVLELERPHWRTRLWVDGRPAGEQDSLSTPHRYDITNLVRPGGRHRLTLCVDNRLHVGVGVNAHSVSDHTQTAWNGVVGRLALRTTPPVWLDDVQVFPDVPRRRIVAQIRIGDMLGGGGQGQLALEIAGRGEASAAGPPAAARRIEWTGSGETFRIPLALGREAPLWDEFSPALLRLRVRLDAVKDGRRWRDQREAVFGLREIATRGTQFVLNGRPIFLRGTVECCIFPLTGYPPTELAPWRRIIRICKQHGLNHIRFHSWCPPEAAFVAADQAGFYFQVECAAWPNQGSAIGEGKPIDRWLYAEGERIVREYGNHPSFLLLASGNEPAGPERGARYLRSWVAHFQQLDPRRLVTSASGWPTISQSDYHSTPQPRIQHWGEGLRSRINRSPPETQSDYRDVVGRYRVPIVAHESGQWCVYPNFDEIPKYRGSLKARNFEIFRDSLEAHHMGDQARQFLMASGKLQAICYKEEVEAALRTPGLGGFQLLQLHDFPGQGTALVGVLDAFWDEKGYISSDAFRRFAGPVTPLARLPKRVWTEDETFQADVEVANFGPEPLPQAAFHWSIRRPGREPPLAQGRFARRNAVQGANTPLGQVRWPCRGAEAPTKCVLQVELVPPPPPPLGPVRNDWDFWVFPSTVDLTAPDDVLIVRSWDAAARRRLEQGGAVLYLIPPEKVRTDVAIGFSSIFWNTAWTRNQAPHTLGLLCDPRHPALAGFPTEYHSNWQWWDLIRHSAAMMLDELPPQLRPIIQPIDTWFKNRRLGLLVEARVGPGRLMVCSIDLEDGLSQRPAARQLRRSVLQYMASPAFAPQVALPPEAVAGLAKP